MLKKEMWKNKWLVPQISVVFTKHTMPPPIADVQSLETPDIAISEPYAPQRNKGPKWAPCAGGTVNNGLAFALHFGL